MSATGSESREDRGDRDEDRGCANGEDPQLRTVAQEEQTDERKNRRDDDKTPVQILGLLKGAERRRHPLAGINDRVGDVPIAIAIELEILAATLPGEMLQPGSIQA